MNPNEPSLYFTGGFIKRNLHKFLVMLINYLYPLQYQIEGLEIEGLSNVSVNIKEKWVVLQSFQNYHPELDNHLMNEYMHTGKYTSEAIDKIHEIIYDAEAWSERLQQAPRSRHSEKPDRVRQRLLQLFGNVSRIELFARKQVEGWDTWGNEVSKPGHES